MTDYTEVQYPNGALIRFNNPEDTGLMLGGRIVSSVPAQGEFEGGYLVACHYLVPKDYIETEFKDGTIYPIKPKIARRLAAGHTAQDIALTYNMTIEEVEYLSPKKE